MKRISYLFFLIFLTSIVASSCSSTETYAQLLDDEQALIHGFIVRNNIQIVSTFPTDTPWVKNGKDIYVLTASGLYYHLINPGVSLTPDDTLKLTYTVVPRFKQYTLGLPSDSISNWNTMDYPYPSDFTYGDLTQSCKGFQEAVSYMKRNYSEAKIIVPSKIGFNADMMSVTPYGYDLKILYQK
jgi:sulfur carrier protein ThiS